MVTSGAVLAIDAGNSKTDVVLLGADGRVAGAARGAAFRPPVVGLETAMDTLDEVVHRAATVSGLDPTALPYASHVSACLANVDFPSEQRQLQEAVHARQWGRTSQVFNDTFAVLRAGTDTSCGVAVVCGAGINCVGLGPDGQTARFPAVGRISGDWGGGSGLVEEALWCASRGEDGRGSPTKLARTLPAHFDLPSVNALVEALYLGRIPASRRHELTPVLFATAEQGDESARFIIFRQAEEIVAMVTVALSRLGLLSVEAPVLFGGSVLTARHALLNERITELLAEKAPHASPLLITAPPVLGAALLGLDQLDAGAAVNSYDQVRAHFASSGERIVEEMPKSSPI